MATQPYISRSNFSAPPDYNRGGSYLGDPLPRQPGVSAPLDKSQPPPVWWDADDPRCGTSVGGSLDAPNCLHQWWRAFSSDADPFVVQLTAEDRITGGRITRTVAPTVTVKPGRSFDPAGLRQLASAAETAADLLEAP